MTRIFLFFVMTATLMADLKLPPEFEPIARLALSAPPEFAADGLLRLLESGKVADRDTFLDLAQQAFDLAASAHFRVPMRVTPTVQADTRPGALAKAYALNLDTVSLQSRAVLAILPTDRVRARQMFLSMAKPELPPLTCEDALVYDVSAFYQALGAVARSGFTAKERAKDDHVAFLLDYVAQVHASAQIAPMAAVLNSAGLAPSQKDLLAVRLNGQIETISGDFRSFSASLNEIGRSSAIAPDISPSFKKYVDRNQRGACGEPSADQFWKSESAQRLMGGARKLRFGEPAIRVLSDAERGTPEWRQQLADFEKEMTEWSAGSEKSEADYYHQKSIVYEALVELIPPGPDRDSALQAFISFINGSAMQAQNPVEWFMPVAAMLQRVRNTNNGEPSKMLAALETSSSPVLSLYAALERALPMAVPSWATAGVKSF